MGADPFTTGATSPSSLASAAFSSSLVKDVVFAPGWRLLERLDAVRHFLIKRTGSPARALVANRRLRVGVMLLTAITSALILTAVAPLWLLAFGPLLLGVPHLLADVRYLILRPGYHQRRALWGFCGVPIVAFGLGAGVAIGLLAVIGALLSARQVTGQSRARASWGAALVMPFIALAVLYPEPARLVLAHLHNFIALAIWWGWQKQHSRLEKVGLALIVASCLAILSGAFDGLASTAGLPWSGLGGLASDGLSMHSQRLSLAPDPSDIWSVRWVLLFAFTQSLHYATWLRLIPDDDRKRPTPRTFKSSWRALLAEFGVVPLGLISAVGIGLALWGLWDVSGARNGYFSLALFHGMLELSAMTLRIVEGSESSQISNAEQEVI